MTPDFFPQPWLINTLLDEGFVAQKRAELAQAPVRCGLPAWLDTHFDAARLSQRSEAQLEERFIGPLFNSVTADWLARFMIQITVNKTYLFRLPVPQPSNHEIRANPDYAQLAKNALLLSLSASWDDFCELAPLFDVQPADVPFTAKARDQLRAENDKTVARLYGISPTEFTHLLRSFKGLATKRPEYLALLQ